HPLMRKTYRAEVYNYRPSWILKWGITISFLFLALIVSVAGFIKYPDVIIANAELTTINPPVHLLAKLDGKLEKVLVREGEGVITGNVLATLESSVNFEHLLLLGEYLDLIDSVLLEDILPMIDPVHFSHQLQLGDLQHLFAEVLV